MKPFNLGRGHPVEHGRGDTRNLDLPLLARLPPSSPLLLPKTQMVIEEGIDLDDVSSTIVEFCDEHDIDVLVLGNNFGHGANDGFGLVRSFFFLLYF